MQDLYSQIQEENLSKERIKSIVESLLFVNGGPIEVGELSKVLGISKEDIEAVLRELIVGYNQRSSGICIVQVAGGYQMCSSLDNESWIRRMYKEQRKKKFSTASLETLAIIVYKQPITRIEIEAIRGVNVERVIKHLGELGLIKTAGRKEVVGRPYLYVTTRKFLEYFGLNSLEDLPQLQLKGSGLDF